MSTIPSSARPRLGVRCLKGGRAYFVLKIRIGVVVCQEACNVGFAILRRLIFRKLFGLVEDFNIRTAPEHQLDNVQVSTVRCWLWLSHALKLAPG
jgi:hypothetical protein